MRVNGLVVMVMLLMKSVQEGGKSRSMRRTFSVRSVLMRS